MLIVQFAVFIRELYGQFRKKRGDTKMGTIERLYGKDFGVRSDKELGNYLKETGYSSLSQLLKHG